MAGIYLHIPFCSQRCIYCDFYFVTTAKTHAPFVEAMCREIEHYGHEYGRKEPVRTIYFGGGTPSLLTPDEIFRILDALHQHFDTSQVVETTLELNPEDVDLEYLRALRTMGIDRLSIGIQSFFEDDLRFLTRSHSAGQAAAIVPMAREAGFENLSIDLIFGLPEQPFEYWGANLERAVSLEVPHISAYGLTVEERTVLHKQVARGIVTPAPDEDMTERYLFTMEYLGARGYEGYEVSSYAREGFRSRHNHAYWHHENYIGLGPSAHSFWWPPMPAPEAHRWANVRNLKQYEALLTQRHLPIESREALPLEDLASEYVMLRLRTSDGVDLTELAARYGLDLLDESGETIAWLAEQGYITRRRDRLQLTPTGRTLCDTITRRLLAGDQTT
jgi:oxygen-independent coproporphyrinogen III oxidase